MISFERLTVINPATGGAVHASAPKSAVVNDYRFRWYTDDGLSYEVDPGEEGTSWVRGHVPLDSEPVKAMQAAFVLSDSVWKAPEIRRVGTLNDLLRST